MLTKAYIPYRGYYSTPFVRWQGSLANEHSIILGANTSRRFFESRGWDPMKVDYVIVDTAGRLHTKSNLMAELEKMKRTAARVIPGAPHEVLLVLDATPALFAVVPSKQPVPIALRGVKDLKSIAAIAT